MELITERILDKNLEQIEKERLRKKLEKADAADKLLQTFDDFITEVKWNKRFELPLQKYLDMSLDPCLKLFLDVPPGEKEEEDDDMNASNGAFRIQPLNDEDEANKQSV